MTFLNSNLITHQTNQTNQTHQNLSKNNIISNMNGNGNANININMNLNKNNIPIYQKKNFSNSLSNSNHKTKLGGILLDENLYGKCILPDSIILINQENISISNFYHLVVSNTLPKLNIGEGKWFSISSELKLKLNIKSYNSKEDRIKQEKIKAIYCQNINEKIKKIKLESGREISSSMVHRFLKLIDGKNNISKWENKLQVGDMIGIHQKEKLIYDKILEIEITNYEGLVFDLEIENSKNYVANEILCHNTSQPCLQIPSSKKYFKFSKSKKPVKINLVVCASCRINFWKNLYSHEKNIIITHKNNNLKLRQTNAESIYLICNYSYWENNYHNSKIK